MKRSLKAYAGFTLVELLVGITIASILSSVGYMAVSGVRQNTQAAKLEQDVAVINNAIDAYVASGGDLTGVTTTEQLFRKLKTKASNAPSVLGPAGSFLDSRLVPVMQSTSEGGGSERRAFLKTDTHPPRLVIATTGGAGIKAFELQDNQNDAIPTLSTENRTTPIAQNAQSGWIWANAATSSSPQDGTSNPGITGEESPPGGDPSLVFTPKQLSLTIDAESSLTYREAGGQVYDQLNNNLITPRLVPSPAKVYLTGATAADVSPANFVLRYTIDGTDPMSSPTVKEMDFGAGSPVNALIPIGIEHWNGKTYMEIKAYAKANDTARFISSPVKNHTVSAQSTQLTRRPQIGTTIPIQITGLVENGPNSPRVVIHYTVNGATPTINSPKITGNSATISLPPFIGRETRTVRAVSFPPDTSTYWNTWFTKSNEQKHSIAGTNGAVDPVPVGVLSQSVWVHDNSVVNGNITFADGANAMPGEAFLFAQTSKINGNMFVPGYPTIYSQRINQEWNSWNDDNFGWHIGGYYYDNNMNPVFVDPPRVYDMPNGYNTSHYTINLKDEFYVKGKIIRGWTPPKMPTIPNPGSKNNNNLYQFTTGTVDPYLTANVSLQTNGTLTLLPGDYGNVQVNYGGTLILGDASNPGITQFYSFESLEAYNNAKIEIVGKVNITVKFNGSPVQVNSGGTMGNEAHPDWLQLNVYSTDSPNTEKDHVILGYGGKFYGSIVAPKGRVFIRDNAQFVGGITAHRTQIVNVVGQDNLKFILAPVSGS